MYEISETFNDWMQRYGQKHQKCPQNGVFPPSVTPKIFFQKSGSVTFVPLWCPNFMQKTRKTNEQSLRYLKTDTRTHTHTDTHGQGRLLRTPSGKPGVQNELLGVVTRKSKS